MKNLILHNAWLKPLSGILLIATLMIGISGCDDDVRVRSATYGSSYYQPYDYYYYPYSSVYFSITSGDYYYYDRDRWRRNRVLPRHYHLDHRDRVKIRIKSRDRPYLKHHEHRTKYGPRKRYDRDYRRDHRTRNIYRNRTNNRYKTTSGLHDYHFYPSSNVYYNTRSGHYYYPERNKWKKIKKLPSRYRLDSRDRVRVKVKSKDRPYIKHKEHRVKYAKRTKYKRDSHRDRIERSYNEKSNKGYPDYQWNRK